YENRIAIWSVGNSAARNYKSFAFLRQSDVDFDEHPRTQHMVRIFQSCLNTNITCYGVDHGIDGGHRSFELLPGKGVSVKACTISGIKLWKVLRRQCEIDIDLVERRQLYHLLTGVDHLPNVHLPDTEHSIEWRADLFFRDESAHVVHRALFLAKG